MIWDSWSDFFAMGGYALYVWGSVVMVAACMLGELISLALRRRSVLEQLRGQRGRNTQREAARGNA